MHPWSANKMSEECQKNKSIVFYNNMSLTSNRDRAKIMAHLAQSSEKGVPCLKNLCFHPIRHYNMSYVSPILQALSYVSPILSSGISYVIPPSYASNSLASSQVSTLLEKFESIMSNFEKVQT